MPPTFSFRLRPLALAVSFSTLIVAGGLGLSPLAHAQEGNNTGQATSAEAQTFNIPAGPLSRVLSQFAGAAGVAISFDASNFNEIQSPGLQGRYSVREGFETLLEGTNVVATRQENGDYVLERTGTTTLSAIVVEASAADALGPVEGYRAERTQTATRTDAPIEITPVSVQVVPEQVYKDQASTRLRDVYRNISGVQAGFTANAVSAKESPIIRGFSDARIYRNGFRLDDVAPVELANVERVEVLKGPASVLFGLGEPGGILNVVTKRPVDDSFAVVTQEVGSHDRYRTTVDANSALTENGDWLGRLNLAYTNDDTFRDHDGKERIFFAPTVSWQPSDATSLTLDFSYSDEEYPFDNGMAFTADGEPVADISNFLGEPDFRSEREEIFAGYTLTHDFNDQWRFRNTFMYQNVENRLNAFRHGNSTNPDNTVDRNVDRSVPKGETFMTAADVGYRFDVGASKHDVLLGVDYRLDPKSGNTQNGPRANGPFPIDIVNPQYDQFGTINFDDSSEFESENKWVGVYLQDQITLADDRLHLIAGARYDRVEQFVDFVCCQNSFDFADDQTDYAFTARGGALYEWTDWLSPYVSVAQSFNPISPFTTSVDGLDPEEGIAYEAGTKLSFLNGRLTSTLAVYQITKDNVPVADEDNPGFSINGGELRSRGFEADIAGELAPGLQVIANYAYTDTEVRESDSLPVGSRFNNVPLHSGSVWGSYDFQPGSGLKGFGFGAGLNGATNKLGNNAGTFELDGFVVADVAGWYRFKVPSGQTVTAKINVNNLTDKEYYESSQGTARVFPGAPRTVIGSVSVGF